MICKKPASKRSSSTSGEEGAAAANTQVDVNIVLDCPPDRRVSRRRGTPWTYYYLCTETGYLDSEAFHAIAEHWAGLWQQAHPGLNPFIVMDRSGPHLQPDTVQMLLGEQVFTCSFHTESSHYVHPLNGQVFARMK